MRVLVSCFQPIMDWQQLNQNSVALHRSIHKAKSLNQHINVELRHLNKRSMSKLWVCPDNTFQINTLLLIFIDLNWVGHVFLEIAFSNFLARFFRILTEKLFCIFHGYWQHNLLDWWRYRDLWLFLVKGKLFVRQSWLFVFWGCTFRNAIVWSVLQILEVLWNYHRLIGL